MHNIHYLTNLTFTAYLNLGNGKSIGSGFILSHNGVEYLVTAKHVLFSNNELIDLNLLATIQGSHGTQEDAHIFEIYLDEATILTNMTDDVAIIELSTPDLTNQNILSILQQGSINKIAVNSADTLRMDSISIPNEVYLIGFPTSLLFEDIAGFDVARPLLRKGILAGVNIEGDTFTIDCPSYQGNSGGPIVELCQDNTLRISGVVSRYIPFVTQWKNNRESSVVHAEYTNSGYTVCTSMQAVFNLLPS
jgi:S1-C subfamily serine protease